MLRAFFFDMDGTLVDSEILWVEAVEIFVRAQGIEYTREEATKDVYGIPWEDLFVELARRYPTLDMSGPGPYATLHPHYLRLRDERDIRIPGSSELALRLVKDYPVGLVSGSTRVDVDEGVRIAGLEGQLALAYCCDDYEPGKPDPACYIRAAQRIEVPPESCLVFEDSAAGIAAAKDAGMHCVALARPGRPEQDTSRADCVLTDLSAFRVESYLASVGV